MRSFLFWRNEGLVMKILNHTKRDNWDIDLAQLVEILNRAKNELK